MVLVCSERKVLQTFILRKKVLVADKPIEQVYVLKPSPISLIAITSTANEVNLLEI
jgi:hypothetical protein